MSLSSKDMCVILCVKGENLSWIQYIHSPFQMRLSLTHIKMYLIHASIPYEKMDTRIE